MWSADEIRALLGPADGAAALSYWGLEQGPNFEGRNILFVAGEPDPDRMAEARRRLFAARAQRVPPGRDDKVLASWNGLACRALAEAGRALERADWVRAAIRNADFVLSAMRRDDGRLLRTWKQGQARLNGYLEDHAMVALALLAV